MTRLKLLLTLLVLSLVLVIVIGLLRAPMDDRGPRSNPTRSVVINELLYNAPDGLDDVQWIEMYNSSDQSVDLGGWTLDDGKLFVFPDGSAVGPKSYIVVALNPDRFNQIYGAQAVGPLKRPLKRGGEKLHLKDSSHMLVDEVRYKDRSPWPVSPDGYSASLERICPTAPGDSEDNWAASPLPPTPRPSGTPGQQNANFSAALPPVVTLETAPTDLEPGQTLRVEATPKESGSTRRKSTSRSSTSWWFASGRRSQSGPSYGARMRLRGNAFWPVMRNCSKRISQNAVSSCWSRRSCSQLQLSRSSSASLAVPGRLCGE